MASNLGTRSKRAISATVN